MAHILVVDDEEHCRRAIRAILEHAGYTVEEARNGLEAVRMYWANPATLVITDVVMPEKDGLETIMELWRDFPGVRIIAVSGGGSVIEPRLALECASICGAMRALERPISRVRLLETVKELYPKTEKEA